MKSGILPARKPVLKSILSKAAMVPRALPNKPLGSMRNVTGGDPTGTTNTLTNKRSLRTMTTTLGGSSHNLKDGGRDGDQHSYASSTAGGSKMQDRVRRVVEAGTGSLLPSLRLLRWSAMLLTALTIALSVGMAVVSYHSASFYLP